MAWILLFAAGLCEVAWAFYMKQSYGFTRLVPSFFATFAMIISVGLLSLSMKTLPLGTAYAVWTGLGTVGAFVVGVVLLGEELTTLRVLAVTLIIAGLIIMKFSSPA